MEESTVYQAILEKGRQAGREEGRQAAQVSTTRGLLLEVGRERFGQDPTDQQLATIQAIQEADVLRNLTIRALKLNSWSELLAGENTNGTGSPNDH